MPRDIFSISSLIDFEKINYLYVPSLTECSPNDTFNNWTKNEIYFDYFNFDIVDTIMNDSFVYVINDNEMLEFEFFDK